MRYKMTTEHIRFGRELPAAVALARVPGTAANHRIRKEIPCHAHRCDGSCARPVSGT
jgi:hypothetical protein